MCNKLRDIVLMILIISLFSTLGTSCMASSNTNEFVWIVEPLLEYDIVFFDECGYIAHSYSNEHVYILDEKTGNIVSEHGGHDGSDYREWIFDPEKKILGEHIFGSYETLEIYPVDQFSVYFSSYTDTLNYTRQADFSDVIEYGENESEKYYSLGEKYTNSKYAIMYGNTIVTEFIYNVESNLTNNAISMDTFDNMYYKSNNMSIDRVYRNAIAVWLNNKWGFIDINGDIGIPFVFEHIASADGNIAFVKYKGKYGILDVTKTALNFKNS